MLHIICGILGKSWVLPSEFSLDNTGNIAMFSVSYNECGHYILSTYKCHVKCHEHVFVVIHLLFLLIGALTVNVLVIGNNREHSIMERVLYMVFKCLYASLWEVFSTCGANSGKLRGHNGCNYVYYIINKCIIINIMFLQFKRHDAHNPKLKKKKCITVLKTVHNWEFGCLSYSHNAF